MPCADRRADRVRSASPRGAAQHRRAAAAIRFGETRFRDIAEASSDWIWETDARAPGRVRLGALRRRSPASAATAVLGRTLAELFHPAEDLERWERHLADLAARRPFRDVLCRLDDAPNHDRTLRIAGKPIVDARRQLPGLSRHRHRHHRRARGPVRRPGALARHDPVTGLPNRLLLRERLAQALAECRRTHRDGGGPVPRPRPLQGDQRQLRPRRRRSADQGLRRTAAGLPARDRHRGAPRRRRVRDRAGRGRARGRGAASGRAAARGARSARSSSTATR